MPTPSTRPLFDRIMGGQLEAFLREHRAQGESYSTVMVALAREHDLNVTVPTLIAWCDEYGIE